MSIARIFCILRISVTNDGGWPSPCRFGSSEEETSYLLRMGGGDAMYVTLEELNSYSLVFISVFGLAIQIGLAVIVISQLKKK